MTQVHKVGPFVIGNKKLGEGATGKVYLSFHEESNAKVAIKVIDKKTVTNRPDKKRKIEQELAILKVLNHPHIIDYYASYETSRYLFVVQELLSGGELFDYVEKKEKLPQSEAIKFLLQISSALTYIHHWNICHRDVKLENILLTRDKKTAKLCDFGNGNIHCCGSPFYAAPELFLSDSYDGCKADIWSLGVCFYVMLFGLMPFGGETDIEIVDNVKKGVFVIPEEVSPTIKKVCFYLEPFKQVNPIPLRPRKFNPLSIITSFADDGDSFDTSASVDEHQFLYDPVEPSNSRTDIEKIAGEPLKEINSNIMQLLAYLLYPLHISKIREELFDPKPNTTRAFYRAIVEHTQNVMEGCNNIFRGRSGVNPTTTLFAISPVMSGPSEGSFSKFVSHYKVYVIILRYRSSVSPAFNEFLRKKRTCSPSNVSYHEESSPIPFFSVPKEIPVGLTLTDTSPVRQIVVELNPIEVVEKMNIVMKDLGILNGHQIELDKIEEMTYRCDEEDLVFKLVIEENDLEEIDINFSEKTIIKYELVKGELLMFNDIWNVIKRQLFELDECSFY
ncbi:non-specific serine/threonine protein kinase [Entamoeba marina]